MAVLHGARILLILLALAVPTAMPAAGSTGALSAADHAKIRTILETYRSAWLANDADAVLRLFTEDAVLMPHHGVEPVLATKAAPASWFPAARPPTTTTAVTPTLDHLDASSS